MTITQNPLAADLQQTSMAAPQTLADLVQFIRATHGLSPTRSRDLISSIIRLASWIGAPPDSLPADGRRLRHRLAQLHHAQICVSEKTLANAKANLRAGLALASGIFPGARQAGSLSPIWQRLRDMLPPNTKYVYHLSRLITWCSKLAITTDDVDDVVLGRFLAEELKSSARKRPERAWRNACLWWGKAQVEFADWPQTPLTVPSLRPQTEAPLTHQPLTSSFLVDLGAFERATRDWDGFAAMPPNDDAWSETTIVKAIGQLRSAAAILERRGRPITSLADLTVWPAVKAVSDHFTRRDKPANVTAFQSVNTLLFAARYWVSGCADITRIAAELRRVRRLIPEGMGPRSEERLSHLLDPHNQLLLLTLPEQLLGAAENRSDLRKCDALDLMVAAMVTILFTAPMRLNNLVNLDLERDIQVQSDGNILITVVGKGNNKLNYPVPPDTWSVVAVYLRLGRPLLMDPTSSALFPTDDKTYKVDRCGLCL